jgi:hypothetical protein
MLRQSALKKGELRGAAQLTRLSPVKKPEVMVHGSKIELRSRRTSCCLTILSIHFFRLIYVLAHRVRVYPLRPRWMNVIGKPPLGSGLVDAIGASGCIPGGGRLFAFCFVIRPGFGRFAVPRVNDGSSAVGEMSNNSKGMG